MIDFKRQKGIKPHLIFYKVLKCLCYFSAALAILALLGIIVYILINGLINITPHFLFGEFEYGKPSVRPALVGTLILVGIALLIAVPIGVFSAIYLTEYAGKSKIVNFIRVAIETLAAIPSIVYGLFGYILFVVALGWGYSLLGGGVSLAIMVLPTIIRSVEESLLAVPLSYREGSFALGAGKVRTIFRAVLPSAMPGIISSIILAAGRIISESAVLILTIGMVSNIMPSSIFSPGTSLALSVYYFANHGNPEAAGATAVILLFLVVGLNLLSTFVGKKLGVNKENK